MKITAVIATVILVTEVFLSCKKEQPSCKGNCLTAIIKGRVYNKISLQGLANISVEAEWHRAAYCIGCTVYKVSAGRTDVNGNFNLSKEIDTAYFKDYYLSIKIHADSNYFNNLMGLKISIPVKDFTVLTLRHFGRSSLSFIQRCL